MNLYNPLYLEMMEGAIKQLSGNNPLSIFAFANVEIVTGVLLF